MPQKKNRVGEERMMNNGMKATIITYKNCEDLDVQFEDGSIRRHIHYGHFKKGQVARTANALKQGCVGETRIMGNGMRATIITYRNYGDIDVQFEDGEVATHKRYDKFLIGTIAHPNVKYKNGNSFQEFAIYYYLRKLGFVKIERGEWKTKGLGNFELDLYNDEYKVAIEYDGALHNKSESYKRDVMKNKRCNTLGIRLFRIRDPYCRDLNDSNSINYKLERTKIIKFSHFLIDCRYELEDILTRSNIPFDKDFINFVRDKNKILAEYNDMYINCYAKERIGQTIYNTTAGQNMTIITYNDSRDCDVVFENGEVKKSVRYADFCRGEVGLPSQSPKAKKANRVGEKSISTSGEEMEIIIYRNISDCDIRFADGTIVCKKDYRSFKKGYIKKPRTES